MADKRDTTLRIVEGRRRQDEALALRLAWKRYDEIAYQLGYTDRPPRTVRFWRGVPRLSQH